MWHNNLLNEDGTPKVFYHGTRESFTEFKLQGEAKFGRALGDGFYFTPSYDKAFKFANGLFSKGLDRGGAKLAALTKNVYIPRFPFFGERGICMLEHKMPELVSSN